MNPTPPAARPTPRESSSERPSPTADRRPPRRARRTLPRAASVLGALLSAFGVVYAGSLPLALLAAAAFFTFYWQLGLPRHTLVDGTGEVAGKDRIADRRVA